MYFKLITLFLLFTINNAKDCLKCICEAESGCKPIGCRMDVGSLSCGYYQIKLPYYIDCGKPEKKSNEDIQTAWKRCSDNYSCATKCVKNYIKRYSKSCKGIGTCECSARLHNGGPNGNTKKATIGYWNKVKNCCKCT
uniref:lysozyme n=1 Tax=Strongyloides venezuelensis TaxID=75913 RepID=A0A0K0FNF1_STRVS